MTPDLTHCLAGRLIRHGARHAPRELAGRLEEEWLADLTEQSPFTRLWFALGCCWAALVIAHEHGAAREFGADAAAGTRTLIVGLQQRLPRHTGAFLLVVCVHLGALQLLATYLVFQPQRPVVVSLQSGGAQTADAGGRPASE